MLTSVSVARSVVGAFSRHRAQHGRDCILNRIPEGAVCAEIGVYKGDFSQLILRRKPAKLHLIDPWKFESDANYAKSFYGGELGKDQIKMDTIHESVRSRFRSAIVAGTVEIHRNASHACCSQFPDNYFDWIYIDGNHQYEFVKQDLEMFLPKVKFNGLVAGDDYGVPGWWQDGVTKAVDETIVTGRVEKEFIGNHQFLLRKR
jgi:Methyltransferase domain